MIGVAVELMQTLALVAIAVALWQQTRLHQVQGRRLAELEQTTVRWRPVPEDEPQARATSRSS